MKGIILAGGLGTRLNPLTKTTNKHLLHVYNKPMIFYPLETLVKAGIKDIMIVTGGNNAGDFLKLLGNGKQFGLQEIHYAYQEGEGGIADALKFARHFAAGSKVVVILGDNIIGGNIKYIAEKFAKQKQGARIILKKVPDPERFGVPEIKGDKIIAIEEKPAKPKSQYAVIGIYMYDQQVFNITDSLKPSARQELEITDVNNTYIKQNCMEYDILDDFWTDAGTFESLLLANNLVAQKHKENNK